MKFYRIRSHYNCNSLGGFWADSEAAALALFNAEMAPVVLDVYAREEAP